MKKFLAIGMVTAIVAMAFFFGCTKNTADCNCVKVHTPPTPVLSFPYNGTTNLALTQTFIWDTSSGARSYHLQIATDSAFLSLVVNDSTLTIDSMIVRSVLANNTKYFWRVNASNTNGVSEWSNIWSFTVSPISYGMKLIPAGTFLMGTESGLQTAGTVNSNGDTIHQVTVSAFYMDSTDVTQGEYRSLMGVNPSYFSGDTKLPVETVTWFDAVLYCNARSKTMGLDTVYSYTSVTGIVGNGCTALGNIAINYTRKGYRLPTEAEWEYACKAGTTTNYWWGADTNGMGARAWTAYNSNNTTQPVATKLANAYGLYDMAGNVWQWCNDWYENYEAGAATNPTGATSGSYRVIRGGGWIYYETYLRSTYRNYRYNPGSHYNFIGFRVVRDIL